MRLLAALLAAAAIQQAGTFRSAINLVPVDVRVLDGSGKPVTNLTAADFKIEEDGVAQSIQVFSTQAFTADADAAVAEPEFRRSEESAATPRNRRVFLIALSRGRHQAASKYVDALGAFVKDRVLPQDQVAIFGWNRATPFTSDRARLLGVIARYRGRHEAIETMLSEWFRGLRALYGAGDVIPPSIQAEIDAVFADGNDARPIPVSVIPDAAQIAQETTRNINDLQRAEQLALLRAAGAPTLPDTAAENAQRLTDLSFDEYASQMVGTMQDLGNLYAGIGYLRHLEGEKHMVVLTERGISLPSQDSNVNLGRIAADARVVVDIVYTGGMIGSPRPVFRPGVGYSMSPVASTNAMFGLSFGISDLRVMTDLTGGQLQAFKTGTNAFNRIADGMQFQYLLGYRPTNRTLDGKFRRVRVTVTRPGLRVMYRQGYFASSELVMMDRREMITFTRMQGALASERRIDHLNVTMAAPITVGEGAKREFAVDVTVDISRVKFQPAADRDTATLDVELFAGNGQQDVVHRVTRRVELKFTPARRTEVTQAGGATFRLTLPYDPSIRMMKIAVFDYGADLIGTASSAVSR